MTRLRVLAARLRDFVGRRPADEVLDDEIRAHLELLAEDHERRGLSPDAARAAARRDFGGVTQTMEAVRDQRRARVRPAWFSGPDLRLAVRALWRQPVFSTAATLTLALGLGSATAIFDFVDRTFMRPLPVREPGRLFNLGTNLASGRANLTFSYPDYLDYARFQNLFAGLVAFDQGASVVLDAGDRAERAQVALVSANFFTVLGINPALGRTFRANEDEAPGSHPVAVLSYTAWQRLFSGDQRAVGKVVQLNGRAFTVIGVAPRGFTGVVRGSFPALYVPVTMLGDVRPSWTARPLTDPNHIWLGVIARLPAAADAELTARAATEMTRTLRGQSSDLILTEGWQGRGEAVQALAGPARLFAAAAIVLLLIVWANVVGLFLARAASRRRETATRLALGASRGRLAAQSLTEGFLIAVLGGGIGLICAHGLGFVLGRMAPAAFPVSSIDLRTFLFVWGLTLMTTLIVGLVPGRLATRSGTLGFLDHRASTTSGWRTGSWQSLLTVIQLSLSLVALFVAGLCLRSAVRLDRVDTGIDDRHVLLATFDAAAAGHNASTGALFYEALQQRVAALPGIAHASFTHIVPFEGRTDTRTLSIPGVQPAADESMNVSQNWVGPEYFATLAIPFLRGRDFRPTDRAGAPPVVIINEAFAQRFWPGQDPIGKTISYAGPGDVQVIGLVRDHRPRTPADLPAPMIYLPYLQRYQGILTLVARAGGEGAAQPAAIRDAARSLDPGMTPYNIRTLAAQRGRSLARERGAAEIASVFGLLCLVVSAVGLYGVMAQAVRRRTREIAIRIALGAAQTRTTILVLRDAMFLVCAALVPGLAGAWLASRLVSSMLYESEALDLPTAAGVIVILGLVALTAAWIPARRAAMVNPIVALRVD